jgi:hypothetical protein
MYMVTTKENQSKLSDRGKVFSFVGYPSNHTNDVYGLWNLSTKHIMKSRG